MEQQVSFSKFGKSFQEDLCHLVLNDRPFADQMFEVLDLGFLELKHLRVFISKIKGYRTKYGVHPYIYYAFESYEQVWMENQSQSKSEFENITPASWLKEKHLSLRSISKTRPLIFAKNKNLKKHLSNLLTLLSHRLLMKFRK